MTEYKTHAMTRPVHLSPLRSVTFTSSFIEDATAMHLTLEWTTTYYPTIHSGSVTTTYESLYQVNTGLHLR